MKNMLFMLIGLIVVGTLAGCAAQPAQQNPQLTPTGQGITPTGETKTFTMTAQDFAFTPSEIRVKQGDRVVITITSTDVKHGFAIPDYGISEELNPGEDVVVDFIADKIGTFTFRCNVPCGAGHREMTGTLIVE